MAYQKVLSETTIPGSVRKESAWDIISDYSRYPAIMDNVDKVEIFERTGNEGISKWYVSVEDAPLYWKEKDHFSRTNYHILFKSIEGDFDNINGQWRITDSGESGIKISFEIEYNLGIPVIEEVLGDILREKMKSNMEKMLNAITKSLGAQSKDERIHPRYPINRQHAASMSGDEYDLFVHNLSARGMMVRCSQAIQKTGTMRLATIFLDIAAVHACQSGGQYRLLFRTPLEQGLLSSLMENLVPAPQASEILQPGPQEAIVIPERADIPCRLP
ncbi:MAG: SRPBCC family protein [Chitinispirillaceae bacterium]|nr:SRPBCC family protein [Chitinispirillaceae bacterium]